MKTLRLGGLACDLAAATISLFVVLAKPHDPSSWLPLAILGLALSAAALRAYSSSAKGFAQRCRRISLRAYCSGKGVDQLTVAVLDDDAPLFVEQVTAKLPLKSMEEYYEPTTPPGALRYAELYAHSAFFTWRLLRVQAWIMFAIASIVLCTCAVLIYHLAATSHTTTDRKAVLDAIATVVLLSLGVKGFEAWWEAFSSSKEIQAIENSLLEKPKREVLKDLVDSYDINRAAGPTPSSLVYNCRRETLASKWRERRKNFVDQSTTADGSDRVNQ